MPSGLIDGLTAGALAGLVASTRSWLTSVIAEGPVQTWSLLICRSLYLAEDWKATTEPLPLSDGSTAALGFAWQAADVQAAV